MLKYSAPLLFLLLAFSSCRKEPTYPDPPQIEFRRVDQYTFEKNRVQQDSLVLVIGYQDGNGDLGLAREEGVDRDPPFDTGSEYENNFIAELQVKRNGQYEPYFSGGSSLNFNGRFPRLSSDDRSEALEGEIRYSIPSFTSDIFNPGDTIRFEVFIYDRALNKSNTVTTSDIILFSGGE
ncbi:hypothetical protein [Pontibacter silvestris]